jgi:hypothetical protein
MSKILRDLTGDCYLEYKPEWTTDVFRWAGGSYIEVGCIDEDFEYTFRMTGHILVPKDMILDTLTAEEQLMILKNACIDWHESKVS